MFFATVEEDFLKDSALRIVFQMGDRMDAGVEG